MALLEDMQQSVTTDHLLLLIPVMLHPLYTACLDSSCPSLSTLRVLPPLFHTVLGGVMTRADSLGPTVKIPGLISLGKRRTANSEPSPGTLSPCPF